MRANINDKHFGEQGMRGANAILLSNSQIKIRKIYHHRKNDLDFAAPLPK